MSIKLKTSAADRMGGGGDQFALGPTLLGAPATLSKEIEIF